MQNFTYSVKQVVENEGNETSSSEIRELKSEKAVALT
jgi:hypothetical protein